MIIQVGNVFVSSDIFTVKFCCDLNVCKGACCIEGDAGAPITDGEIQRIEPILQLVESSLSQAALNIIHAQGVSYKDRDGESVTSIVNGKDCVFTCYDKDGCCLCALEKSFREGKTDYCKPISCHLYPIRVTSIGEHDALNYHCWNICHAAVEKGRRDNIPLYRFLKGPLIRKYGSHWYDELELVARELKQQHILDSEL